MKVFDINTALELKSAEKILADTPQSRIIEEIARQEPQLLGKAAFILALCEMYFLRKISTGDIDHLVELLKKHDQVAHLQVTLISDFEGSPV